MARGEETKRWRNGHQPQSPRGVVATRGGGLQLGSPTPCCSACLSCAARLLCASTLQACLALLPCSPAPIADASISCLTLNLTRLDSLAPPQWETTLATHLSNSSVRWIDINGCIYAEAQTRGSATRLLLAPCLPHASSALTSPTLEPSCGKGRPRSTGSACCSRPSRAPSPTFGGALDLCRRAPRRRRPRPSGATDPR